MHQPPVLSFHLLFSHISICFSVKKASWVIYEMCPLLSPSKKFLKTQPYFNYSDSILLWLCTVSYTENCFKQWCSSEKGSATLGCTGSGILRGSAGAITEAVVQPQKYCSVGHPWTRMFSKTGTDVEKSHKDH